jgi:hypothetical protein
VSQINAQTIANARTEIQRLNCQLRELHLEEERCRLKRSRLEAEHARVKAFVEMCELAHRFDVPVSPAQGGPIVQIVPIDENKPNGVKLVTVEMPKERQSRKPANTPPMKQMITAALQDAASHGQDGLKPRAMIDFVREKWWPDARASAVCSTLWQMAHDGALARHGKIYKLNGAAQ